MNRGLLLGSLGTAALAAALRSIADGGTLVPPVRVLAGLAAAAVGLTAIGAGSPELADGLAALVLLTALYRLPWGLVIDTLNNL